MREHSDYKLYEIVKFFYNQMESESGGNLKEPFFAQAAGHDVKLALILNSLGGGFYGEQVIPQKTWNKDLAAVMVAITSARNWFLRHDHEAKSADTRRGREVMAGAKAGGKRRCIPFEVKMREARRYQAELDKLMQEDKWLKRTRATDQVGRKNGRSGRHVRPSPRPWTHFGSEAAR